MIAAMDELDEDDLVRILREPKNALTKAVLAGSFEF